jgi:relaxase-like protein/DNA relaxase TraI-like protein/conjugative element/phage-associated large polyvalent protein
MIAKIIPIKSVRKSSFVTLVQYLTNPQDKSERVNQVTASNCYTDEPAAALLEIQNTQEMNKRAKSDKTCHLVLSFPEGEQLSLADLNAIEEQFCEALGFTGHQRISVVHDDTNHLHIHIAINKIHPKKLTIHNPYYDYKKVANLCERIEQEYSLVKVNHVTRIDKTDAMIQDIETKAGIESLLGWIRRECLDDIKRAGTWQVLHEVLKNHGLTIKERGNGFVFVSSSGVAVKASSIDRALSKPNLIKRLGTFELAAHTAHTLQTAKTSKSKSKQYQPRPLQNRIETSTLYARYRQEQSEATSQRKTQWVVLRDKRDRHIERAKQNASFKRSIIKRIQAGRLAKKTLYAAAHMQFKTTIEVIKSDYRQAYTHSKTRYPKMAWLDWLAREAKHGNNEALAVLRSRGLGKRQGNSVSGQHMQTDQFTTGNIQSITKDGTVCYNIGSTTIRDDGQKLIVPDKTSQDALHDILHFAIKKYGSKLAINGTDTFRDQIVKIAVASGLNISFDDDHLEQRRQTLIKQNAKQAAITKIYHQKTHRKGRSR